MFWSLQSNSVPSPPSTSFGQSSVAHDLRYLFVWLTPADVGLSPPQPAASSELRAGASVRAWNAGDEAAQVIISGE